MDTDSGNHTAFLNGNHVEIAPLATIDFSKLATNDGVETQRLLDACIAEGFFYLDLQGPHPWRKALDDQQSLLDLMKDYFDQPHEVKMKDDMGSMTDGSSLFSISLTFNVSSSSDLNPSECSPALTGIQETVMRLSG
jgi:isopenicillin N synthase-like dioxygenase